jgi:hypothetical protein
VFLADKANGKTQQVKRPGSQKTCLLIYSFARFDGKDSAALTHKRIKTESSDQKVWGFFFGQNIIILGE